MHHVGASVCRRGLGGVWVQCAQLKSMTMSVCGVFVLAGIAFPCRSDVHCYCVAVVVVPMAEAAYAVPNLLVLQGTVRDLPGYRYVLRQSLACEY